MSEEREALVDDLNDSIDSILDRADVDELIDEFQKLADLQQQYQDKKKNVAKEVREFLHHSFPEEEVIGGNIRVRDGDVYKNNSPSKADKAAILDAVRTDDRFTEDEYEAISDVFEVTNKRLKREIDNKTRVLMADDRVFDAVTLEVRADRRYLKLVRLDGGKSHKMQPLEDIVDKHVEELIKFVRYQEEKMEVTQEMIDRVTDTLAEVEEKFDVLEEVDAGDSSGE